MQFFVTCAKGTEGALRKELVALRIRAPRGDTGGVSFAGSFEDGMKVCLWSRVAMRVLLEVAAFPAPHADALYAGARAVPWTDHLDTGTTFAVSASVQDNPSLRHSGFAALKVKDAVADALRDALGARPDVSTEDPDVALFLHLRGPEARLFLDLAGEPLHRRGYRVAMTEAPLKESLAAAVLALGRVDPALPFIDPMAGSGTLAIEQAMAARRLAPGLQRKFGFQRWPRHSTGPDRIWASLVKTARQSALPKAPAPIIARDSVPDAITAARRNAEAAGVAGDITFEVGDVAEMRAPEPAGTVCFNPPYGERLAPAALDEIYRRTAQRLRRMKGWAAVILAGNPLIARAMGGQPELSHKLWNGPIEVRLLRYRL
jgi:putative N6-adenine-specific DNA methylase